MLRYTTDWDDPSGGWLLLGDRPFSLMPGRRPADLEAERGIDEDVYFACPGMDPLGILGY